ncbi:hypothetical protein V499_04728 [Pseudogymnoascus sp. VKM F-103]|nr:hypothetical protein V499_04728 [Pseudogymnoascus sp. VKM F-103]
MQTDWWRPVKRIGEVHFGHSRTVKQGPVLRCPALWHKQQDTYNWALMAEVVGILGSGAGIASLGCQIFKSIYKLQQVLTDIRNALQELKTILEEIALVTTILIQISERPHLYTIGRSQSVARDQAVIYCETAYLVNRLERAKSILALAQLMYLQSFEIERLNQKTKISSISTAENPEPRMSTTPIRQNENGHISAPYNQTTFQLGIGVLVVRQVPNGSGKTRTSLEETIIQFRFADWFLRWAISIAICPEIENVAAAWHHPSTCKQLLEHGANSSLLMQYSTISWNALGLASEYAGYYRCFLFPGLEEHRPGPKEDLSQKRETMRILTDHNSCEVHQGYRPGHTGYWNGSTSALHMFRGTSDDFLWLYKRENVLMDVKDSEDYIASIVIQQTQMFPNAFFPAAFSLVSSMEHLANADPTSRNDQGYTPLMGAARDSLLYLHSKALFWTAESAAKMYSGYLTRWIKTLESCLVDAREYRSREIELGAESFVLCRQFQHSNDRLSGTGQWSVRLVFGLDDIHHGLQIKFQFQSEEKNERMPGSWPKEII